MSMCTVKFILTERLQLPFREHFHYDTTHQCCQLWFFLIIFFIFRFTYAVRTNQILYRFQTDACDECCRIGSKNIIITL